MRILFVIKSLVENGGGAERVLVNTANALAQRGYDIHLATFDNSEREFFYKLRSDIVVYRLGTVEAGLPTKLSSLPKTVLRIRSLCKRLRPNLAVSFMHSSYVPLSIAVAGLSVPFISSEHIDLVHYKTRPAQKLLMCLSDLACSVKTVCTKEIRSQYSYRMQRKIIVVPNPVAVKDMTAFVDSHQLSRKKVILSVGRMAKQKDYPTLLAAFAKVSCEFPDWKLRIIGDGELLPELVELVRSLDLADRVEFPGFSDQTVYEYAEASVFAMPSLYEALPLVAIEALACRLPVVAFASCPGATNLVKGGMNGLLAEDSPSRSEGFSQTLRSLLSNESLREHLGSNGPESVADFDVEAVVDTWDRLLKDVARCNGSNNIGRR